MEIQYPWDTDSVHPTHPLSAGEMGGVEPPTKILKGGLDRTSTFRGGCWESGGDFFQGVGMWGCNGHIKNN